MIRNFDAIHNSQVEGKEMKVTKKLAKLLAATLVMAMVLSGCQIPTGPVDVSSTPQFGCNGTV